MPTFLENAIRHSYRGSNLSKEEIDHRVYGHMENIGAMHGNKITAKGRAMEKKHDEDKNLKDAAASIPRM